MPTSQNKIDAWSSDFFTSQNLNVLKKLCSLNVPKDNFKCTNKEWTRWRWWRQAHKKKIDDCENFSDFIAFWRGSKNCGRRDKGNKIFKSRVSKPACLHSILTLGIKSAHFSPAKNFFVILKRILRQHQKNPFLLWSQINPF